MRINNKGFTMVELLASVAILGVLSGLAIVAVSAILNKAHEEYYNNQEKNLVLAAQAYYNANKTKLPKVIGKKATIKASELKKANYLKEDLKNYDGKPCDKTPESYVTVFKYGDNEYSYNAYLNCGSRSASESEKGGFPTFDVNFKGVTIIDNKPYYKNVGDAKVDININGGTNESGNIKLISYSYIISKYDNATNRYVELVNTGNKSTRETDIHKEVDLTKFTIKGEAKLKITLKATNINGNSSSKTFINNYKDDVKPKCEIKEEDKAEKTWLRGADAKRTIKVGCKDDNGSGCVKDSYTKTFTKDAKMDAIRIYDSAGNYEDCMVSVYIDRTAPTIELNAYASDYNREHNINRVGYKKATSNNTTFTSSEITNNYNSWLNGTYYSNGIYLRFNNIDNVSSVKSVKWSWNNAGYTDSASGYANLNGGNKTEVNSDKSKTNYVYDTRLSAEGHRYATIEVEDYAGNTNKMNVSIKLDKTAPTITSINNDYYKYTITAIATDYISLVDKVRWGDQGFSDIPNSVSYSFARSGITTYGFREAYAIDVAGNSGANLALPAYKLFDRLDTNSKSRTYWVGDTIDYKCEKDADFNDDTKNHPWKRYHYAHWDCTCTYDYYSGAFYTFNYATKRTGDVSTATSHANGQMIIFYNNSDNGVSACKGDISKNSYVWDVCREGKYPTGADAAPFHGYWFYSGAAGAYAHWHKNDWYHDSKERDNHAPFSYNHNQSCAYSCQIAGRYGDYAHSY